MTARAVAQAQAAINEVGRHLEVAAAFLAGRPMVDEVLAALDRASATITAMPWSSSASAAVEEIDTARQLLRELGAAGDGRDDVLGRRQTLHRLRRAARDGARRDDLSRPPVSAVLGGDHADGRRLPAGHAEAARVDR